MKNRLSVKEMCIFSMLGSILFLSKLIMEMLPNIHLVGTLVVAYTVVYRAKALIPIYIFVLLTGVYAGFSPWWVPYIYIWTLLWGGIMLIPRGLGKRASYVVYPIVSSLHGFLFGVLYAPMQALLFGFGWEQTVAWVAAGFYFDILHGVGNLALGTLIYPISTLLTNLSRRVN